MKKNLWPRTILVLGVIGLCAFFLLPNVLKREELHIGPFKMDSINLGLDLKGGMHVVLKVRTDKAIQDELGHSSDRLKDALTEKNAAPVSSQVTDKTWIDLEFASEQAREQASAFIKEFWTIYTAENRGPLGLRLTMIEQERDALKENALLQAKETIENRIDEFAVKEPQIYTQGADQIVVRLPGIVDPTRAKGLIGKTAVLEFKIVEKPEYQARTREQLMNQIGGTVPAGYDIYGSADDARAGGVIYLLKKVPEITGSELTDARRALDQLSRPAVDFQFNSAAGKRFGDITGTNLQKQLAIVLDNKVVSAPVIQSKIYSRGQITGDFTNEEARDLAIVLRAGSLPVPVEIEEERTVGPTLGEDSIRKGLRSFLVGGIVVVLMTIGYYRRAGVIAVIALLTNVVLLMGTLALFGATLTLPGIAGILLTVGMAVDANVIINERIREEIRAGKTPRASVEAGYEKALWAILDANITTAVAGVVLYQFGTGPIKGFAVTLLIGLATSVFSAVVGTRLIYDYILQNRRGLKALSI